MGARSRALGVAPLLFRLPLPLLFLLGVLPAALRAEEGRELFLDLELGVEGRRFFSEALDPRQEDADISLRFEPELSVRWRSSGTRFVFRPFLRVDSSDEERTHADVRELYVHHRAGDWDLRAGVRRVFWGAIESAHLVDVLNQTDLVENPDGEDKLGQPMAEVSWGRRFGTFSLFVLPAFRERTFAGVEGRLRPPLPLADDAVYESTSRRSHVDWAVRYSAQVGSIDLGVSHFSGTSREPRLVSAPDGAELQPVYDLADQTSIDATAAVGAWLWKLEALRHRSRADLYHAAAAGFEHTTSGVAGRIDLGLLLEYLWDERGRDGASPYQNDVFGGVRLGFNDAASTHLLAGVIADLESGWVLDLEASRRLTGTWSLVAELRWFWGTIRGDALHALRRDDHALLELIASF